MRFVGEYTLPAVGYELCFRLTLKDSRITLVGIVFIPLSFATSFFGMNFAQFGAGVLHIGYFFPVAGLSGLVAFLLAASIKTSQRFWLRARNRYRMRKCGDEKRGAYQKVSIYAIFWGWLCRTSSSADAVNELWKSKGLEVILQSHTSRLPPHLEWTVSKRVLQSLLRGGFQRLKQPFISVKTLFQWRDEQESGGVSA